MAKKRPPVVPMAADRAALLTGAPMTYEMAYNILQRHAPTKPKEDERLIAGTSMKDTRKNERALAFQKTWSTISEHAGNGKIPVEAIYRFFHPDSSRTFGDASRAFGAGGRSVEPGPNPGLEAWFTSGRSRFKPHPMYEEQRMRSGWSFFSSCDNTNTVDTNRANSISGSFAAAPALNTVQDPMSYCRSCQASCLACNNPTNEEPPAVEEVVLACPPIRICSHRDATASLGISLNLGYTTGPSAEVNVAGAAFRHPYIPGRLFQDTSLPEAPRTGCMPRSFGLPDALKTDTSGKCKCNKNAQGILTRCMIPLKSWAQQNTACADGTCAQGACCNGANGAQTGPDNTREIPQLHGRFCLPPDRICGMRMCFDK